MKYKELIWIIIRLILDGESPKEAVMKIANKYDLLPSELWNLLPEHYKD